MQKDVATNSVSSLFILIDAAKSDSKVGCGTSSPLGATVQQGGVNFSVYSKNATLVELLLFDQAEAFEPSRVVSLDARKHRTYHYWHAFVADLMPGQVYGFRAVGPFDPERGLDLIVTRCCSILTVEPSPSRRHTAA